ncbi:MAG: tetratricopeptide repeat protein [Pseudonocardia sp.]|nr:tetratricopeptide repeat protein [Pseudonocardia sp.]
MALALVGGYFLVPYVRARQHLAAAERALDDRDFATAKDRLEKYLATRPDDPTAHLLLARTARRAQKDDEAAALLGDARRRYPDDAPIKRESQLFRMQQGDLPEVNAALSEGLARPEAADPLALEAALVGGLKLLLPSFLEGETAAGGKAAPFLAKVNQGADLWLRARPGRADQVEGLVWRGLTRAYANDAPGAQADFRAALALDPAHHDARLHLAMAVLQESPREGADHLHQLLSQKPADPRIKYTLAGVLRSVGRPDEARRLLDEVLATNPNNVATLLERGALATDQGELAAAERLLARAVALAPDDPKVNFALASCLRAAGRTAEAKTYQDRFLRIQDDRRKQMEQAGRPAPAPPR